MLTLQTLYDLYVSISTFDVEKSSYENMHVHEYNASYSLISCARFEVLTGVLKKINPLKPELNPICYFWHY